MTARYIKIIYFNIRVGYITVILLIVNIKNKFKLYNLIWEYITVILLIVNIKNKLK